MKGNWVLALETAACQSETLVLDFCEQEINFSWIKQLKCVVCLSQQLALC